VDFAVFFEFGSQRITVNVPGQAELEAEVKQRFRKRQGFALATVNLDHLVKLAGSTEFAGIYAKQDLVVADGRPIVWLSHLAGSAVDLLPGSDLVEPLCQWAAETGVSVALVGSTQLALQDASEVLCQRIKGLNIALCHAPSGAFDPAGAEADAILKQLDTAGVGLCFLALGAPKQEAFALRGRRTAPGVGFASVGAGLDFLGGHQNRAPLWVRKIALEWVWRLLSDPVRLAGRYLRCFAILPGQAAAALRQRRAGR
jgi:N-acetylglucosaminyldiphosphoundecaprenol N-acetyl-beta-D-mannosaminyltransferase